MIDEGDSGRQRPRDLLNLCSLERKLASAMRALRRGNPKWTSAAFWRNSPRPNSNQFFNLVEQPVRLRTHGVVLRHGNADVNVVDGLSTEPKAVGIPKLMESRAKESSC